MLDVHPPHEAAHTWKDFLIHIATICVGLLIAIGLEQAVEAIHHHHQRVQLEQDLHDEAINNRKVIARDLNMRNLEAWFATAVSSADNATPVQGKLHIDLPPAPCIPGSVGTASVRYFAPSEAVISTARENSLITLLPVASARMYARLDHNYKLLGNQRDIVFNDCDAIAAMQQRLATPHPRRYNPPLDPHARASRAPARKPPPTPRSESRAYASASAGPTSTSKASSKARPKQTST